MRERSVSKEIEQRIRVLEIGSGILPANTQGGTLFARDNIDYVGIEVRNHRNKKNQNVLYANAAHMPFADDAFDYILMRSIFGQFTGFFPVSHKDDICRWGMYESFRVLKPGGTMVISEENTPWKREEVSESLMDAGFSIIAYAEKERGSDDNSQNDQYRRLRDPYFMTPPTDDGFMNWRNPYILIAEKPVDPIYEVVEAEVRQRNVNTNTHLFGDVPDSIIGQKPPIYTIYKGEVSPRNNNSLVIAYKTYKKGKRLEL